MHNLISIYHTIYKIDIFFFLLFHTFFLRLSLFPVSQNPRIDTTEYLQNVKKYTEAIPIRKYTGGIGRHAVAKQYGVPGDKCGWPQKATQSFLDLLKNVESNAESKGLNIEDGKETNVHKAFTLIVDSFIYQHDTV